MHKLYVLGIGYRPLNKQASEAVLSCDEVLASKRLMEVFASYEEYEFIKDRIVINQSIVDLLDYIRSHRANKRLCLLASGDPMFFGIGRRLTAEISSEELVIIPDLSCVQVAFNRLNEAWDDAFMISLHGGPIPGVRRRLEFEPIEIASLLKKHKKLAILTDKVNNPALIAKNLSMFSDAVITVCERLGYPDERITTNVPSAISQMSFDDPNVVIVKLNTVSESNLTPVVTESSFEHKKGMITKDEVRAFVLQQLNLHNASVLWDIGAGSGAISIESALQHPSLRIFAVEKDYEMVKHIYSNIAKFQAINVSVLHEDAVQAIAKLPISDRVFVGGSGGRLNEIINLVCNKMTHGIVVMTAVKLNTLTKAVEMLKKNAFVINVSQISAARLRQMGRLEAINPVFVIRGIRTESKSI